MRELFVISRSSSFVYKDRIIRAEDAARELGVRYILEGSVRVAGDRVRVSAQLIDGLSGGHVWAERYEGDINDIFAVQDEITRSIGLALQVKLTQGEAARLWEDQTKNLRAWEKFVLARDLFLKFSTVNNGMARRLLEEALLIDPNCTGAIVKHGITYYWDARYSVSVDKELFLNLAESDADRALKLNPEMGAAHVLKAAIALTRDQHDEALRLCERAADLAPGDSLTLTYLSNFYLYAGDSEKAALTCKTAMRLSPQYMTTLLYFFAFANLWMNKLSAAQEAAEEYLRIEPDEPYAYMCLAVIHGFLGRTDEAAKVIFQLRERVPEFGIKNIVLSQRYREQEKLDRIVNILRTAGLPE